MFFGLIRSRKPIIHEHWFVPLKDFVSNTEEFYQAMEAEVKGRRMPELTVERITFSEGGWVSGNRAYLRMRRERVVFDLCSAAFGTGWWFSLRAATLPRVLYGWEVVLAALGIAGFAGLYWQLFGLATGAIAFGASVIGLLLVFLMARKWASLDEFVVCLPVVGALYEAFFRKDTYYRLDQRLVTAHLIDLITREKVTEFCVAGGLESPEFIEVYFPDQILTRRELSKYLPTSLE